MIEIRRPVAGAIVVAVWLALVGAACGDDDGGDEATSPPGDVSADADAGGTAGDDGSDAPAATLPAEVPPAGEARVEVDGQVFTFLASESLESVFTCEVGERVVANFQSDRNDLLLQANPNPDGGVFLSVTVRPEATDRIYSSTSQGEVLAVDGASVAYTGSFTWRTDADPGAQNDVGAGTVVLTCP